MKVLVTGGGGFVGLALVKRLVKSGYEVSVFSRNIYPEHKELNIKIFTGNLVKLEDVENSIKGNEIVFHVAARVGVWGSYKDFYSVNVTGTENVINACIKHKVRKLIFTSSASVIFDGSDLINATESARYPQKPASFYSGTKATAEKLILKANSDSPKTIALRPHLVWGPGDTQLIPGILHRAKSGRLRKIGKRDYFIDTTHIENLIDAQLLAIKALDKTPEVCGKAFFITNGSPVTVWEFINSIIVSAGMAPVQKTIPRIPALFLAWLLEKTYLLFRIHSEPYVTRFVISELCTHHYFDISAARKLLGYSPKVYFE